MEIITVANLAAYLQTTIADDNPSAVYIVELVNGLASSIFDDTIPADVEFEVEAIVVEAAARAWRNPAGATSRTRSFDDMSKTERWETVGSGRTGVYFTDSERDRLEELAGKKATVETIFVGTRFYGS